jgi:acyl-CoA thioester hydrolase
MSKPRARRADYAMFVPIATRWMDNDVYGHINNVIYYSWIDSAVARFLTSSGFLHIPTAPVIGLVVETQCRYLAPIAFPDDASAEGYLVHVYVDRATQKTPTPLPENLRAALQRITLNPS